MTSSADEMSRQYLVRWSWNWIKFDFVKWAFLPEGVRVVLSLRVNKKPPTDFRLRNNETWHSQNRRKFSASKSIKKLKSISIISGLESGEKSREKKAALNDWNSIKVHPCSIIFGTRPTSVPNPNKKAEETKYRENMRIKKNGNHRHDRRGAKKLADLSREHNKSSTRGRTRTGDDLCEEIITNAFSVFSMLPPCDDYEWAQCGSFTREKFVNNVRISESETFNWHQVRWSYFLTNEREKTRTDSW